MYDDLSLWLARGAKTACCPSRLVFFRGSLAEEIKIAPPLTVRVLLLALLPVVALAVWLDGRHYDPGLLTFKEEKKLDFFPEKVENLSRIGSVRRFSKDNLYEYINGHAEFFISAGFLSLTVGEYSTTDGDQPVLVINVYDMGKPLHAYGVLMDEAGENVVDIGAMGFRTDRGINFIQGPYYVQTSAFAEDAPLLAAAREVQKALGVSSENAALAFQFPDLGTVASTRFVKENYRGLDFLHKVVERAFVKDEKTVEAFLVTGTAESVARLEQSFINFFKDDGTDYEIIEKKNLRFYRVYDPYEGEWFFVPDGKRLLGVYAVLDETLLNTIQTYIVPERKPNH
ncbi:MAG: hypothetical protein GY862_07540 [Gammaproteobacteria bacterium]|nr:hypothetical protein [Gammaproteobacteria bacterium]